MIENCDWTVTLPSSRANGETGAWNGKDFSYLVDARHELSWIQIWTTGEEESDAEGPYQIRAFIADRDVSRADDFGRVLLRVRDSNELERDVLLGSIRKLVILPLSYEPPREPERFQTPPETIPACQYTEYLLDRNPQLPWLRKCVEPAHPVYGRLIQDTENHVIELGCAGQVSLFRLLRSVGTPIRGIDKAPAGDYGLDPPWDGLIYHGDYVAFLKTIPDNVVDVFYSRISFYPAQIRRPLRKSHGHSNQEAC